MARYISFAVLLAIIVVIGALFYKVMIGFFVPVFLAAVLVVVFKLFVHGGGSSFESNKSLRLACPRGFGELYCRAFVTVDPSLAFATVMPVKSRASIDSQFLAANGRIVTLLGNLGKDAWVRTVNIDRNSLQT